MTSRRDRGDRGKGREIPDKMIVDPRLREDDEEGGAGKTSRGNSQGLTVTRVSAGSNGSDL